MIAVALVSLGLLLNILGAIVTEPNRLRYWIARCGLSFSYVVSGIKLQQGRASSARQFSKNA